jgi:hypothetical protein
MRRLLVVSTVIAVAVMVDAPWWVLLPVVWVLAATVIVYCALKVASDDWCRAVDAETERRNRLRGES